MCALTESEYEKVHSYKSSKEIWNTLAPAYEGTFQITRQNRPLVTTLKASKDLKKLLMEELLGTLKTPKDSASKALKVEESCGDTLDEDCSDEDKISFISRKVLFTSDIIIYFFDFPTYTKETKGKTQVVCYECKKLGYFKYECPNL
ncbi:hypothetical protein CR513_03955, partial [Mucuna pruriens]